MLHEARNASDCKKLVNNYPSGFVMFHSKTCPHCTGIMPLFKELMKGKDGILIGTDTCGAYFHEMGVRNLPTIARLSRNLAIVGDDPQQLQDLVSGKI